MVNRILVKTGLLLAMGLSLPLVAQDAGTEDMKTTIEALKVRVKDQEKRLADVEAAKGGGPILKPTFKAPDWTDGLKFVGDLRLRYEVQDFDWETAPGVKPENRERVRYRARFGIVKTWAPDGMEIGMRLASGNDNSATSTNQTLDGNYTKKDVWIDLAYAKYSPSYLKGFTAIGGKMARPWMENEVFMDSDISPEGLWAEYTTPKAGPIEFFGGLGYYFLQEVAPTANQDDVAMKIAQLGARVYLTPDVKYTVAAKYQDFMDYANDTGAAGGNAAFASVPCFRVISIGQSFDFVVAGQNVSLSADIARNVGEADPVAPAEEKDFASTFGVKIGQNKAKGDWSLRYRYANIQANAMPGQFVDSDFGGAGRHGSIFGAEYNLLKSLTAGVSVLLTEPSDDPIKDRTTTVMFDLIWKL